MIRCICVWNFGTKFFLGGKNVKPEKIQIFLRNGKTVILVGKYEIFINLI